MIETKIQNILKNIVQIMVRTKGLGQALVMMMMIMMPPTVNAYHICP